MNGQVIGLIPKNFLIIILSRRIFYSDKTKGYHVVTSKLRNFYQNELVRRLSKKLPTAQMTEFTQQPKVRKIDSDADISDQDSSESASAVNKHEDDADINSDGEVAPQDVNLK